MNENIVGKPRIGGWLIFIAIGLITSLPSFLLRIFNQISFLLSPVFKNMANQYAKIGLLSSFELLGNLVIFLFLCIAVYSFFKKKNSAPKNMIIYMLAILVYEAIDFVLGIAIMGAKNKNILIFPISNIISAGIICAIWIPYFIISKRVKATFIN